MDEMLLDGKNHVSSRRASEITGYAKDYVGQLCREGRIEAQLIGRSWYVNEESLRRHRFGDGAVADTSVEALEAHSVPEEDTQPKELTLEEAVEAIEEGEAPQAPTEETPTHDWQPITYTAEEVTMLPEMSEKVVITNDVVSDTEKEANKTEAAADEMQEESVVSQEETKAHIGTPHIRIRRTEPYKAPAVRVMDDIRPVHAVEAPVREERPGPKTAVSQERKIKKTMQLGQSVMVALLVAFVIFVGVFSAAVAGLLDGHTGPFSSVFDYLGGTSTINKD